MPLTIPELRAPEDPFIMRIMALAAQRLKSSRPPAAAPPWHELEAEEVLRRLGASREGLSDEEARRRAAEYGPNALAGRGGRHPLMLLRDQFASSMILLLLAAAGVSAAIGDLKDAIAVAAIVLLNAGLGFSQEWRAEKAMAALKALSAPSARVKRDGAWAELPSHELVPGDVVALEAGGFVAADARVLEAAALRAQEAALTGESEAVEKSPKAAPGASALGDRLCMVYQGTAVVNGRGEAVVTATGMRTELGRIAALLGETEQGRTPLQRRLDQLGRRLAGAAVAIAAAVLGLGLLRGEAFGEVFLTAVSLAVAAVPEGLPAVVTVALALGAQRMLKRGALIRRLHAVETLGSVTVICSDKTGTLTQNRMSVAALRADGRLEELDSPEAAKLEGRPRLALLLASGALCSDASLEPERGDPTELALLRAADERGLRRDALDRALPRRAEAPFDSVRKRMTTVHELDRAALESLPGGLDEFELGRWLAVTKGAVSALLPLCDRMMGERGTEPMTDEARRELSTSEAELAKRGQRVLGLAIRPLPGLPADASPESLERELVFVGLAGLVDPPRPSAKAAVAACRRAGIRPVMITGDHALTARAIADQLGLEGRDAVEGPELESLSPEEIARRVDSGAVFARVAPEHKLRIIAALQKKGENVAMTGDGVNDAPALKRADIGVAMGRLGTDVAKEASDMILLDDDFATIVSAVEEGRVIHDNIRKFLKYLVTTNSSEVLVTVVAPFVGMPLPLTPLQILWINLVTDGPTAVALGVEPAEEDVMSRPPRPPEASLLGGGLARHAVIFGLLMTVLALGAGFWAWSEGREGWRALTFTTLAFCQMGHVLAIRSNTRSFIKTGLRANPWLAAAVAATIGLQLVILYFPPAQRLFETHPLSAMELGIAALAGAFVTLAVELEKRLKLPRRGIEPRSSP